MGSAAGREAEALAIAVAGGGEHRAAVAGGRERRAVAAVGGAAARTAVGVEAERGGRGGAVQHLPVVGGGRPIVHVGAVVAEGLAGGEGHAIHAARRFGLGCEYCERRNRDGEPLHGPSPRFALSQRWGDEPACHVIGRTGIREARAFFVAVVTAVTDSRSTAPGEGAGR